MFEQILKSYFKKRFDVNKKGDAREESYYSALEFLLKNYAESVNKKDIHVTTLPKKTEAGNPDFRVWDGKQQIGGYQVCDKWLKDRKGRTLSLDVIRHYCKVVTAIEETIKIQKDIDRLYPEIEKGTIEFRNKKE